MFTMLGWRKTEDKPSTLNLRETNYRYPIVPELFVDTRCLKTCT